MKEPVGGTGHVRCFVHGAWETSFDYYIVEVYTG